MELKIAERLMLLNLLPKESDVTTLRIVRDLQRELAPTEEEHEKLEIGPPTVECCKGCNLERVVEAGSEPSPCTNCGGTDLIRRLDTGRIKWRSEADVPKDVTIGRKAMDIIRERLETLSEGKELSLEQLSLYDKFVGTDDE